MAETGSPSNRNVPARAQKPVDPTRSRLAQAIETENENRRVDLRPVQGFFHLGNRELEFIGFRVAVKDEEDLAIVRAHAYASTQSKRGDGAGGAAAQDIDLLGDAKLIEALYVVCRDAEDPKRAAFPGPDWMRKNLGTDQVAALIHLYLEVKRARAPVPYDMDEETIERASVLCAAVPDTDLPEAVLAGYSREFLTHGFVVVSRQRLDLVERLDAAQAELEELRAQLTAEIEASGEREALREAQAETEATVAERVAAPAAAATVPAP